MKTVIAFSKQRFLWMGFSLALIVAGFAATFIQGGFRMGIDFQPGISLTVQLAEDLSPEQAALENLRSALTDTQYRFNVQPLGEAAARTFVLRASITSGQENIQSEMAADALKALETRLGAGKAVQVASDYIGPSLSTELVWQTFGLTLAAIVLIFAYTLIRFQVGYAVGAIIALVHDTLFILALVGALQLEVTTAIVAAVLTIIGYSLNDTIVVFDRMRENSKLMAGKPFELIIDTSITQSLGRTVITSVTTQVAALALFIFTTGTVRDFALALLVGIIAGTFSSIYIASPVLLLFKAPKKAADAA